MHVPRPRLHRLWAFALGGRPRTMGRTFRRVLLVLLVITTALAQSVMVFTRVRIGEQAFRFVVLIPWWGLVGGLAHYQGWQHLEWLVWASAGLALVHHVAARLMRLTGRARGRVITTGISWVTLPLANRVAPYFLHIAKYLIDPALLGWIGWHLSGAHPMSMHYHVGEYLIAGAAALFVMDWLHADIERHAMLGTQDATGRTASIFTRRIAVQRGQRAGLR